MLMNAEDHNHPYLTVIKCNYRQEDIETPSYSKSFTC